MQSQPQHRYLTKDLELLKIKLRHLLQYLNTTKTKGLFYLYPRKKTRTHGVYPSLVILPLHHQENIPSPDLLFICLMEMPDILIHWQSLREPKIAESSAEAELSCSSLSQKVSQEF